MRADALVHHRLRHRWRVLLVVTQLTEAHDIDDHVLPELLPEIERKLRGKHHRLGIIAIHMQHRRLDHFGNVGAINGGACVARIRGGKADLVVDHDVDRAARAVTTGLGQIERFHHHALPGERRIAVHHNRQHLVAIAVAATHHPGLGGARHHRIDDLQMRRVEGERHMDRTTRGREVTRETVVVLHITRGQIVGMLAFKFSKQIARHFAQHVHEHIQTPAMRHANDDFLNSRLTGTLDQFVHGGNKAFTTLERESFLTNVSGVQIALETFGRCQALENAFLLVGRETGLGA